MTIDTAKERSELEWLKEFAFFSCRTPVCAEEVSYPAHMLRVTPSGDLICENCWDADIKDGDGMWSDLSRFVPFARHAVALDVIDAQAAEIEQLLAANQYDPKAAQGMTAEVELGEGAGATIIDPRSFEDGGAEWVMRYGNPASISLVVASLLSSYDDLLSCGITMRDAERRLRLMRKARASLSEREP